MHPHRAPRGRSLAGASITLAFIAIIAVLAGCSSRPQEIVGPSQSSAAHVAPATASDPMDVLTPPPLIERWESPRIRVWTDGWRAAQKEGGVSLEEDRIYDLDVPEQEPLTFYWSARPRNGQGEIAGYRWSVDIADILDETPRSGPDDLSHWSAWSATETSTTLGPYSEGETHLFHVEARDNLGFFSLFTIRLHVVPASDGQVEGLTRR